MTWPCGCDWAPGTHITVEARREHQVHTLAAMLMWELLVFEPRSAANLAEARLAYLAALEERHPELAD